MTAPRLGGQALWIGSVAILLVSGLGAYTVFSAQGTCEEFELSPATGGDSYEYAANGSVLLTSNRIIAGDWNVVDGPDEQGVVTLGKEGRMDVTIAPEPEEALSVSGAHRPAFQVSYVASDPARGSGLHVADEWLDEEHGETNEARMPSVLETAQGVLHHRHFTKTAWAGLMHAPDLWERSLAEGDRWNISFPEGRPNTRPQVSQVSAAFTVERLWDSEQGCQARVDVTHSYANASLTLLEDVPVPTTYQIQADPTPFEMRLESWEPGDGPSLAPISRSEQPRSGSEPLKPLEDQFLADAEGTFSTNWPTALAVIEEDSEAQTWLGDHPNAAVTKVDYVQGASVSDIENRWTVTWWPGPEGGASMENQVTTQSDPISEALDEEISVDTSYVEKAPRPEINESVTLSSLEQLHQATFGSPLETIRCKLSAPPGGSKCYMAPHDDINKPRAGGFGGGVYHAGLIVDLRDGRALQETSYAERLIDPPAQGG